jgi:hypothetical protein
VSWIYELIGHREGRRNRNEQVTRTGLAIAASIQHRRLKTKSIKKVEAKRRETTFMEDVDKMVEMNSRRCSAGTIRGG